MQLLLWVHSHDSLSFETTMNCISSSMATKAVVCDAISRKRWKFRSQAIFSSLSFLFSMFVFLEPGGTFMFRGEPRAG